MAQLSLSNSLSMVEVDDADYAIARRLGPWNTHSRGGKGKREVYVRKGFTLRGSFEGKQITVNLHHLIAKRAGLDVSRGISFKDGNTFNLRRDNLVQSGLRGAFYPSRPAQLESLLQRAA